MKVAIIGAGISGLACAIELERQGIRPVIFEEKHRIGSPFPFAPMLFNFLYRPAKDQLSEIKKKYNIDLKPISNINFLRVQGPESEYTVEGNIGYSLLRGQERDSIESQMANQLKTPIHFETPVKVYKLIKDFDYLVVADGTKNYAQDLQIWQNVFSSWIRGATVLGRFNPHEIRVWLNKEYAGTGFAYMVPMGTESASLILIVSNTTQDQLPSYWNKFLQTEKIQPEIVMNWDTSYDTGLVYPHRVGNTFFIGNSGGLVSSWLGVGIYASIVSGIEAARSIVLGNNYEEAIKPIYKVVKKQARLRQFWDKLDNHDLDWAVKIFGTPLIKHPLFHTNIDMFAIADPVIKFFLSRESNKKYKNKE